jgi:hypothetical protein
MTINERLEQIQRRWHCDVKYTRPADPAAVELHEFVADLLDEIENREWAEGDECDCDVYGDLAECEHADEFRRLEQEHADRMGDLAPAIEELHRQAHGDSSLYMCSAEPCRGLYKLLPNARGQVLAP